MRERHYTGFLGKRAIVNLGIFLIVAGLLASCKSERTDASPGGGSSITPTATGSSSVSDLLSSLGERVQGASGDVQEALSPKGEILQEMTKEEVEKLFRWEYHVVAIPGPLTVPTLQERLTELGTQGWECFNLQSGSVETILTCKRRPRSAIQYLKLIPGM